MRDYSCIISSCWECKGTYVVNTDKDCIAESCKCGKNAQPPKQEINYQAKMAVERTVHAKDFLQPFKKGGELNRDFAKAWPKSPILKELHNENGKPYGKSD